MNKSKTIKDISREANVSTTTVSRVLNGMSREYRISEKTEHLVLHTAQKLKYRPNHTAVSLRLQKSNLIGLLIPDLSNPFFSNIASIVSLELRKRGFSVIVTDCYEDEKTEIEVVDLLQDRRIDGLLVMPSGANPEHLVALYKMHVPVVCIDRYFTSTELPYVATHNYKGAYETTQYLISCGHEKIVCIQGVPHVMPNIQRVKGYLDAMLDAGLQNYSFVTGNNFSQENGYLETKLLLQKEAERPTAIFCLSNTILLGVLKSTREEGLKIPNDISLVTFDDAEYLKFLKPAITSVSQPVLEIAKMSIKILYKMMDQKENKEAWDPEQILLSPTIIFRKSVRNI